MYYSSTEMVESTAFPGVSYEVRRLSLLTRIELIRAIRQRSELLEFHSAGKDAFDQLRATELSAMIEALYVDWGLAAVHGFVVDGHKATPREIVDHGPEAMALEAAQAVRRVCFLSEEDRKN